MRGTRAKKIRKQAKALATGAEPQEIKSLSRFLRRWYSRGQKRIVRLH